MYTIFLTRFSKRYFISLFAIVLLGSCSNDEESFDPAVRDPFIGEYVVVDIDAEDSTVENYEIEIRKSAKNERRIEILNFGDLINVPVEAEVNGTTFEFPQQVFTGSTYILTLTGQGSLTNGKLVFDYNFLVRQKSNDEEWDMGGHCEAEPLEGE
jgi:hypothetical protein